jgi:hypothetical protein
MRAFLFLAIELIAWGRAWAQPVPRMQSFYAEVREEDWFQNGQKSERIVRITRLADRSTLSFHPYAGPREPAWRAGRFYFYLVDRAKLISYAGDMLTGAAWPQFWKSAPLIPDRYGDCSVLSDHARKATEAGKILSFPVWRIEPDIADKPPEEAHREWVAPELGCFALRSQVLVDEVVRERVEAVKIQLLPEDTKLSLPKGIRVVSPKDYYELYKRRHRGDEVFPKALLGRLQRQYEQTHPRGSGQ